MGPASFDAFGDVRCPGCSAQLEPVARSGLGRGMILVYECRRRRHAPTVINIPLRTVLERTPPILRLVRLLTAHTLPEASG